YGWGLFKEDKGSSGGIKGTRYCRTYTWNERNQLISSVDTNYSTAYVYGQDGQRSNKYTQNSETLYFNKMWTLHTDSGNSIYGGQSAKNIYLGETRIVTKLNSGENPTYQEEYYKQYYYHSDHLGSASLISDYKGDEYQRIEYTPYGETWVEKTQNTGLEYLPYRFTGKEIDEETGLYYYGARYLDPRYSMWISTDPALSEYIPKAPIDKEAMRYNQNLLGMGGVFNHINGNLYHYAGNNPVKYTDPDGECISVFIVGAIAVGIFMLPKRHSEGFLYFDNTQPQRIGGYFNFYENFTSNLLVCNIDSLRTDFINSSGKTSSIWLWKGNYNLAFNGGWHVGAEVGAYDLHGGADDNMFTSVSFELKNKKTGDIVSRTIDGQYWTNRFDKGKCNPADLVLTGILNFKNENDAKAYCDAVNAGTGKDKPNTYFSSVDRTNQVKLSASRNGNTVTVTFE
ncbi:MAG: RHS repeat-associated core domain-containing protein, partial [Roseburia sp.]